MIKKIGALLLSISCLLAVPLAFSQEDFENEAAFDPQNEAAPAASAPTPTQTQTTVPPPATTTPAPTTTQSAAAPAKPAGPPAPGLQPAGQVVWVSGTVKATYPDQTPRVLARGAMIYEKDTINTYSAGSGQLSF